VRNRVKFHYARNRRPLGDAISHPSRLTTREEMKGRNGGKDTLSATWRCFNHGGSVTLPSIARVRILLDSPSLPLSLSCTRAHAFSLLTSRRIDDSVNASQPQRCKMTLKDDPSELLPYLVSHIIGLA